MLEQTPTPLARPYPPSWINRLFDRIDRFPGPYGLLYLLTGLAMMGLETAVKWRDGSYPVGTVFPFHLVLAVTAVQALWGLDDATRSSREALKVLRPLLTLDPAALAQIHYRMRYLPPRGVLWAGLLGGLLGGAFYTWVFSQAPETRLFRGSALGLALDALFMLVVGGVQGTIIYATYHLQTLIGQVYAHHLKIDLLIPQPLYALAAVSTRAALLTFASIYLWMFTLPSGPNYPLLAGIILSFGILGLIILVLPLRGVRRRLVTEKRRMQAEVGRRIEAAIARLCAETDSGQLTNIDALHKLFNSLELARQAIERASTWPWHPDTPRLLLSATLLPLAVWVMQRILSRAGL